MGGFPGRVQVSAEAWDQGGCKTLSRLLWPSVHTSNRYLRTDGQSSLDTQFRFRTWETNLPCSRWSWKLQARYYYSWSFSAKLCFLIKTANDVNIQNRRSPSISSSSSGYHTLQNYGILNLQNYGYNDNQSHEFTPIISFAKWSVRHIRVKAIAFLSKQSQFFKMSVCYEV